MQDTVLINSRLTLVDCIQLQSYTCMSTSEDIVTSFYMKRITLSFGHELHGSQGLVLDVWIKVVVVGPMHWQLGGTSQEPAVMSHATDQRSTSMAVSQYMAEGHTGHHSAGSDPAGSDPALLHIEVGHGQVTTHASHEHQQGDQDILLLWFLETRQRWSAIWNDASVVCAVMLIKYAGVMPVGNPKTLANEVGSPTDDKDASMDTVEVDTAANGCKLANGSSGIVGGLKVGFDGHTTATSIAGIEMVMATIQLAKSPHTTTRIHQGYLAAHREVG